MSAIAINGSESEAVVQAKEGEYLFAMGIIAEGRLWVFPYMNLRFCEANNHWLDIVYHSHTIHIEGDGLQGIGDLLALQRVRRLRQGGRGSAPLITRVEVTNNSDEN